MPKESEVLKNYKKVTFPNVTMLNTLNPEQIIQGVHIRPTLTRNPDMDIGEVIFSDKKNFLVSADTDTDELQIIIGIDILQNILAGEEVVLEGS